MGFELVDGLAAQLLWGLHALTLAANEGLKRRDILSDLAKVLLTNLQ